MATNNPDLIKSSYLSQFLRTPHLKSLITRSVRQLKNITFDSVAFRGMSGSLIGPPLALRMDKNMIMVRKLGTAHSILPVEGFKRSKKYIIADDFIDTGLTVAEIYYSIRKFSPKSKCLGVLCATDDFSGERPLFMDFASVRKRYKAGFKRYRTSMKALIAAKPVPAQAKDLRKKKKTRKNNK